jgi:hypothetical protein
MCPGWNDNVLLANEGGVSMDLPWWVWFWIVLIVLGIAMRQAMKKLKAFYGGAFHLATQNPVGSAVTRGALSYFLRRIFR